MMHKQKPSPETCLPRLRRRALYTLLTIAVLLTLLPPGLRIGGEYALKQLGAEAARIDDIDLNLFSGRLAVHGLQLDYAGQATLRLDTLELNLQMLALLQQRILLQQLRVSGLDMQVFQQDATWVAGLPLPPAAADAPAEDTAAQASAWQFGIQQLQLQDLAVTVRYQTSEHMLQLDELRLNPLLMWAPEDSSALAVNARINQAPMTLTADIKPFAETLAVALHISLADLQLAALQDVLPPETIQQLAARLSMDSDIRLALHSNGDMHIDQHGDISVALDQLAITDASLSADAMRWQGRVKVAIAAGQPPQLHAAGEASLAGLAASYLPLALSTTLTQLSWQGEANVDLADTDNSVTAGGRLQLDNWQLHDQQQQGNLLQFDALALDDMRINGLADISLASVALTGLQALQHDNAALAGINTITLADIHLQDQQQLAIADLAIDTLGADLLRNANGNIEVLDDWQASLQQRLDARQADTAAGDAAAPASADDSSGQPGFSYAIGAIRFTGDSRLRFTDATLQPAIVHTAVIEKLAIGTLDSNNSSALTPLELALKLYDHGSLSLTGEITPLQAASAISGTLDADINGIELTDLSPYLEQAIGYHANSGQLNISSHATLDNGQLDSSTELRALRIDLAPANPALIAKASQKLAMPVETALMAITDSNNTLKLTIPVSGDLANPDIGIDRIISSALTQATKNAALTYFKYAVQPFGAIMMVSQTIGDMHLQARFEDVRFVPGEAAIVPEQSAYLAKVAAMIGEKKQLSVLVCVMVTDRDFQAMGYPPGSDYPWDERSETLARQRLNLIRSTLINGHGLSADRVQSCKPALDKGQPRAIMGI